jgi:hypothetical protein
LAGDLGLARPTKERSAGLNDRCYRIGDCGVSVSNVRDVRVVNVQARALCVASGHYRVLVEGRF